MKPDFDKIQPGITSGVKKTTAKKEESNSQKSSKEIAEKYSFKGIEDTGVAGRSSIKIDNLDTDMAKFDKNYEFADATNKVIDYLVNQGYPYEEAVNAVYSELGV